MQNLQLLTLAQIEGLIGRKVTTLRTDIREGRLEAVRLGRQVRITEKSLRAFLAGQRGQRRR